MYSKKLLAGAIALTLFGAVTAADAVSLGNLTVNSRPGQPLAAVLDIEDVDLTVSPLLVRLAPPATYLREGVNWPAQAQDLRLSRDPGSSAMRLRITGQQTTDAKGFPLLIELNAGGTVTVRHYSIDVVDHQYVVSPSSARTLVKAEPATITPLMADAPVTPAQPENKAQTKAQSKAEAESAKPAVRAAKAAPARKSSLYAKHLVERYVALNGFDASEPFKVQRNMTLWSVAGLYWPSYRGATYEQLLTAMRNANPKAFARGELNKLVTGAVLTPPDMEAVLAVDPLKAFREVHGEQMAVPLATHNLIQAQKLSPEVAAQVADAQDRERAAHKSALTIGTAGERVLQQARAELAQQATAEQPAAEIEATAKAGDASADADAQTSAVTAGEAAENPQEVADAADADDADDAADAQTVTRVADGSAEPEPEEDDKTPATVTPAEQPAAESAPAVADTAAEPSAPAADKADRSANWALIVALLLALIAFLTLRRKRKAQLAESAAKAPKTVKITKSVPPATPAQMVALRTTVDEAVKNKTTAGAMGAGAMAYTRARMADEATQDAQVPAEPAEPAVMPEAETPETKTAEAVEPEAVAPVPTPAAAVTEETPVKETPAPEPAQVPPEGRTRVDETAGALSPKDKALRDALEAKYKLAKTFVLMQATDDALELLDEVKRRGSADQRKRALALEEAIRRE